MTASSTTAPLVVSRVIAASPEVLFDAWTDADSLAAWMRPGDGRETVATVDVRVGGTYTILMHGGMGSLLHRGTYTEVDRPRRLAFTWESMMTEHSETLVTVDFTPLASGAESSDLRTEVRVTHERLPHQESWAAHSDGWTDCLLLLGRWVDRIHPREAANPSRTESEERP